MRADARGRNRNRAKLVSEIYRARRSGNWQRQCQQCQNYHSPHFSSFLFSLVPCFTLIWVQGIGRLLADRAFVVPKLQKLGFYCLSTTYQHLPQVFQISECNLLHTRNIRFPRIVQKLNPAGDHADHK
jgi:hypothetical protein